MRIDKDKLTTITGAIVGAATAAEPVINSMAPGTSLHSQDYVKLLAALGMFLWGFFTNKQ